MKVIPAHLRKKAQKIKLLLLDVDGVLTDGGIVIDRHGNETKRFDVRDGQGLALLKRAGVEVGLITGRSSDAVRYRAKELGIKMVYQGVRNKRAVYERIKARTGLADESIAYVGDDLMDIPLLRKAGLAITVKDGWPGVRHAADYVTMAGGGHGAVREISELIIKAQNRWQRLIGDLSR